jgi:putative transcriptional regulator
MVKDKGRIINSIKEHRLAAKMTQADLAEAVGATRQTVNAIEAGKYAPTMELAFKITIALGQRFDDVFQYRES